jgi:predicted dehydrogenase
MKPCRVAIIGCGGMGRHHIRQMLKQQENTQIVVLCDPAEKAYAASVKIFNEAGCEPPPNQPDFSNLLQQYQLDAAFIVTPHVFHYEQARACLEAGLDVLVEKPMVMNSDEAEQLIEVRIRTGKLLVVAFPGSLSPQLRSAVSLLRSGKLGEILSISGVVWQDWGPGTVNTWRQVPEIAGGGFLFDTGAHLLNTVVDLAGVGFETISAWFDYNQRSVETEAVAMGRLPSGAMVTLHACGEAVQSCSSEVHVFCQAGILRTGIWGERLDIQWKGETVFTPVEVPPSLGVWEQFIAVREGRMENPCPPEVGLRMNRLYDAIQLSAKNNGQKVNC